MAGVPLPERMKAYEDVTRIHLTRRTPVIIRVDGRAFHRFTKGMEKPFDDKMIWAMAETAQRMCEEIGLAKLAYIQSDEISILLTDYDRLETQPWFDNDLRKLCSVTASLATGYFNIAAVTYFWNTFPDISFRLPASFDSRAFNVPKEEVNNYFIWRQKDTERNSIQGLAQSLFLHKEIHGLKNNELQNKMLVEKNINWNDLPTYKKRGFCVVKNSGGYDVDLEIPIFSESHWYVDRFVLVEQ